MSKVQRLTPLDTKTAAGELYDAVDDVLYGDFSGCYIRREDNMIFLEMFPRVERSKVKLAKKNKNS